MVVELVNRTTGHVEWDIIYECDRESMDDLKEETQRDSEKR